MSPPSTPHQRNFPSIELGKRRSSFTKDYFSSLFGHGCGSGSALFLELDPDSHSSGKLDQDQHLSEKLYLDPHLSQNSEALEARNRAVEGLGRSSWRPGKLTLVVVVARGWDDVNCFFWCKKFFI
jgi:hypothetical protein